MVRRDCPGDGTIAARSAEKGAMLGAKPGARSVLVSGALRRTVRWGLPGVLAAGALIAVLAGPKAQPKAPPTANAPVLAADEALGEATRSGDKTVARRLLSLQFSFVDEDGKVHTRKDFIADLKGMAAAPASDPAVRNYGLLVTITGHRKSVHGNDVFFLDIWAKQRGSWRVLVMQDVLLGAVDAPALAVATPAAQAKPHECKNPCQAIPYRVRSPVEQDIINAFQVVVKAIVAHDASEWGKHVADEFMLYGSGRAPVPKSVRVAMIERQKESNATTAVGEVQAMRLSVYGDGAAMIATDAAPGAAHPPYRAARVWVKRNGQWLLAISLHTDIK
jgi:hypothetical protein